MNQDRQEWSVDGGRVWQLEGREGYVKALLKKWAAHRGHRAGHPRGTFPGGSGFQWEQLCLRELHTLTAVM